MIDQLVTLLQRETDATGLLERRLRALELVVAAGEQRFVGLAVDELEQAAEALSALELTRALALSTAGLSPDVSATDLTERVSDADDAALLGRAIGALRAASQRLVEARARAHQVVATNARENRTRLDAAEVLSAN